MNLVFKPIYLNVNHGFKFSNSCHNVLIDVKTWDLCGWFLKITIFKLFNRAHQKKFMNFITEIILDKFISRLVYQMFYKDILLGDIGENIMTKLGLCQGKCGIWSYFFRCAFTKRMLCFGLVIKLDILCNNTYIYLVELFNNKDKLSMFKSNRQSNYCSFNIVDLLNISMYWNFF